MSWPINLRPVHLITRRIVYQIKSSITFPILPGKAVSIIRYSTTARLSSPFNPARLNPVSGKVSPHNGIDYSMPMNTKIVSVIDGKITRAEYNSTMGYFVEVTGKAGVKTRYLHLNKILVTKGARVTRGGAIALSGNSGRSSGPHLHYELVINNNPVNSLAFRAAAPLITNSNSMPLRMPETTNDTWTDNGTATRPRLPD